MSNHPNRNWRTRMRADQAKWLESSEADVLINVPVRADDLPETLRKRLLLAYQAGYGDGRKSK